MKTAIIALGSNLKNPVKNIQAACKELQDLPDSQIIKISSLYQTKPVGYTNQPDFINAVLILETNLDKHRLLGELHKIENKLGRVRSFANAPRTLDLDIIDYDNLEFHDDKLILPHPRATQRAFVMVPLAEIAPDYSINNKTAQTIADSLDKTDIVIVDL